MSSFRALLQFGPFRFDAFLAFLTVQFSFVNLTLSLIVDLRVLTAPHDNVK